MKNDVPNAKLSVVPNSCTLNDVEICYKGVHEIYTVSGDGEPVETKEIYGDESYFSYYYCTECNTEWHQSEGTQEELWEKVEAHLEKADS